MPRTAPAHTPATRRLSVDARCTVCGTARSHVVHTTTTDCGTGRIRRRHCLDCGNRWWTVQPQELVIPDHALAWTGRCPTLATSVAASLRPLFASLLAWQQQHTGIAPHWLQHRVWQRQQRPSRATTAA